MGYSTEYIKQRTLEIYHSLPQEKELRKQCLKERDEIIELNYTFFGYVASHKYVSNSIVTYEDKLQSALLHFCECWWWYLWKGDETHKGYRQDLSFAVFFKLRLGEMIERELVEVKYSIRRTLCMEAGEQLNKHWAKVTYDDLAHVDLPADKILALKAIFGSLYKLDIDDHLQYVQGDAQVVSPFEELSTDFDSIEELLIYDMCRQESKLTDSQLLKMSDIYDIPYNVLKEKLPIAEQMLHEKLVERCDIFDIQ